MTDLIQPPAVIGITMSDVDANGNYITPYEYVHAIQKLAAIAVCIPPSMTFNEEILASLDGCILSGGGDIHPSHYHGFMHPSLDGLSETRDEYEFKLVEKLLQYQMPTLAICRGLQVINCVCGGTLYEHIPELNNNIIEHKHTDNSLQKQTVIHDVTVTSLSTLAKIYSKINFPIVSWHHQAIKDIAPHFNVVAVAADGIVEAIESAKYPNLLAVQWHPELSLDKVQVQHNLFEYFINLAITNRSNR